MSVGFYLVTILTILLSRISESQTQRSPTVFLRVLTYLLCNLRLQFQPILLCIENVFIYSFCQWKYKNTTLIFSKMDEIFPYYPDCPKQPKTAQNSPNMKIPPSVCCFAVWNFVVFLCNKANIVFKFIPRCTTHVFKLKLFLDFTATEDFCYWNQNDRRNGTG